MSKSEAGLGRLFLHIALALIFLVQGILITFYGEQMFAELFGSKDIGKILNIAFGIVSLATGIILAIQLFMPIGERIKDLFMLIILVVVIVEIVLIDVLGGKGILYGKIFSNRNTLFGFMKQLATHLMLLGSVLIVRA